MFFYQELDVFGAVPVHRKKMKILTMGEIHCTSRSYLGAFFLCAYHRFPEGIKLELAPKRRN